ncbi:hypothetical protein [Lewinella sp. 4G2]|uniref:hypothetical protein n=1 Tax=Lewinella sp. 4G2 TaxID=1803372 RepID=UPI0007B4D107|nr:hypothetical protein [Lewinella sp. 4G2]OAV46114.1 hypothetical protein A3850_017795 [Lewinella sp. 4G2]
MRFLVILSCIFLLFCTCDSAPSNGERDGAVVFLNYEQDQQLLTTRMNLGLAGEAPITGVPTVYGSPLDSFTRQGVTTWQLRKNLNYPSVIPLEIPCGDALCNRDVKLAPVFVDSFPNVIDPKKDLQVAYGPEALTSSESLVFYFGPQDRSAPEKIKLVGPTNSPVATLPSDALAKLKPGKYNVYLIKQQLKRDTTARLWTSIQAEYMTRTRLIEVAE